jgi:hypothetical protein
MVVENVEMVMESESMVHSALASLMESLVFLSKSEMGMCCPGATTSGYSKLGMIRGVLLARARRETLLKTFLTVP